MRFSREMNNSVWPFFGYDASHLGVIADVALYESVPRMICDGLKIVRVAGVCQLVEVDDSMRAVLGEHHTNEGGTDESGAAGDQKFHWCPIVVHTCDYIRRTTACASS